MKFKEIKNKKLNELTMGEISFFLNYLEGLQAKYGVPSDFINIELFSDLSGSIKRDNHEELTSIWDDLIVKEIESSVKKIFRDQGREYEERRKEQDEYDERMNRKRDWEFNFVVEGVSRVAAEALIKAITTSADEADVIIGGGFHEYDKEVGKRE